MRFSQPGEFSRRLSSAGLALNDFGSVAIRTLALADPPPLIGSPIVTNRIVRVDGAVVTTVAERTDDFRPATGFSLNNAGEVAFSASDSNYVNSTDWLDWIPGNPRLWFPWDGAGAFRRTRKVWLR